MAHLLARAALRRTIITRAIPRIFTSTRHPSLTLASSLSTSSIRFRAPKTPKSPAEKEKAKANSNPVLGDTTPSGKEDYDSVETPPEPPRPPPPPPVSEQPAAHTTHPHPSPISPASDTPPRPTGTHLSLDFSPVESPETPPPAEGGAGGQERTGAKSSSSLTSLERKRRRIARILYGAILLGMGVGVVHLGREWEKEELEGKKHVEADLGRWERTKYRFKKFAGVFSEPVREELLLPRQPQDHWPYVLLLSLDDLLVTSTWDRQHGWRTAKRPGVDYFLGYLSNWFEIIIFTTQPFYTAEPIMDKLDPLRAFVVDRITREGTRYVNGEIVKDLNYLNRDHSKVIAIDTDPKHYALHPENAIIVPKWDGDPKDKGLIALIPFLESIAIYSPPDVRPIISAYKDKDVVAEYAKVEAEAKRRHLEDWLKHGGGAKVSAPSFLQKIFGTATTTTSSTSGPPPTYLERKRAEAQQIYTEHMDYLKRNEEAFKKMYEEQKEAQLKEMGAYSLYGMINGWMGGAPPGPPGAVASAEGENKYEKKDVGKGEVVKVEVVETK